MNSQPAAFPRTLVIIPALNEAANIAGVIARVREQAPWADIAVINDGSVDDTGRIAQQAGAIVLHLPYNVGIGAAVQTGLIFAAQQQYDVVVRSDGDGQHTSQHIPTLVQTLVEQQVDFVIGSRFLQGDGYRATTARRMGIVLLAKLISLITGQRITDPTSGFTAFSRRAVKVCARFYPHDYPEPEGVVLLHRAGLSLLEVPVMMQPRQAGQSSITALDSIYYMFKVTLAILISLLRRRPALDS